MKISNCYKIEKKTNNWIENQWIENYYPTIENEQWKTRKIYKWIKINNWKIKKLCKKILQKNKQNFHNFELNKIEIDLHLHGKAFRIKNFAFIYKRINLNINVINIVVIN